MNISLTEEEAKALCNLLDDVYSGNGADLSSENIPPLRKLRLLLDFADLYGRLVSVDATRVAADWPPVDDEG